MPRNRHSKVVASTPPLVDICILTAGKFDLLRKCLDAAEREAKTVPSRIFVADNASDRHEKVKNMDIFTHPDVQYFRSEINTGYPTGYNDLIRRGSAPLVLVLTDDVILEPGALDILVRNMDDPSVGVCAPKLLFPLDSTDPGRPAGKVQCVGLSCNLRAEPFHIFMGWDTTHPKVNGLRQVFAVTGACFIVRRHVFQKAGGFFTGYGMGTFEDVELSLTIRSLGYKIVVDPAAVGYHSVGATAALLGTGFPLQINYMLFKQRNVEKLFWSEPMDW